ncbi:MAG: hypothetical protein MJA29_11450 [Candidatus Omnitrophica bacterium]|nr:hypothetical protein [Candidatus Omnitrophota bacterium]
MKRLCLMLVVVCLLVAGTGCEAFIKKFKREPKKKDTVHELVLEPESYDEARPADNELARQYYSFWRNWHDELITALASSDNHKKKKEAAFESVRNLENLAPFMKEPYRSAIGEYIAKLEKLYEDIAGDIHSMYGSRSLNRARDLKRRIEREFPFTAIDTFLADEG